MSAADVHARLGTSWPVVLAQLGIDESFLRPKKAGPCPACGGRDRYTFDNRRGRGDFFCRGCGAGDGFELLARVHGWDFREALRRVAEVAGIATGNPSHAASGCPPSQPASTAPARPTRRVLEILRGACEPQDVGDVITYLESRHLWPLPSSCALRAHASVEYWHDGKRLGRNPALLAEVRDLDGALVSLHVTYLAAGAKLSLHEPRKILAPLTGRISCAVRLVAAGDVLGIAEGIETALAAHRLLEVPTWAALSAALLSKFEPPSTVTTLVICADRDAPGLEAAARLMERLQGRLRIELRLPRPPAKDWADVLS